MTSGKTMHEQWADQTLDKIEKHLVRLERRWAQERKIEAIKLELDALRQELEAAGFGTVEEELQALAGLPSLSGGGLQKSFGDSGDYGLYLYGLGMHTKRFTSFAAAESAGKRLARGGKYGVTGPGTYSLQTGGQAAKRFFASMTAGDRQRLDELCGLRGCTCGKCAR